MLTDLAGARSADCIPDAAELDPIAAVRFVKEAERAALAFEAAVLVTVITDVMLASDAVEVCTDHIKLKAEHLLSPHFENAVTIASSFSR